MTSPASALALPFALALLTVACGPQAPMSTTDGTDSNPDSTGGLTTTTGPSTTTTTTATSTTAAPTTTSVEPDPGTAATSSEGGTFITPPDVGNCVAGLGEQQARCSTCNPFLQNCPSGEKCVPASSEEGAPWHTTACVPLDPDPDGVGEPCTIEPHPTRLIDSCDAQSICLGTDPDTLGPVCVPLCEGSPEAPECPAGSTCVISNDGVLIPCLPN
ncbi:hypothetical protein [Nannocystis bainbridge]|uniref:Uncharacterized protein n=1 Tax=Nannocystis bainbridge TaxID=2995303 RepID=A0ABT5DYZ5_9BACT|nr:hypothetical protein [Nannocystis bainbridge]MDC0718791.1 hypothetical protein [Nannocystis bainbridge]